MTAATLLPHTIGGGEATDRLALQHLAAAYGHGIDRRDYALVRSLYHDDAIDDHAPFFTGSADDYVAWLPSIMAGWSATAHTALSMLFLIDGDVAEGEVTARAWHLTLDGTREFIAWGRYADRYARREGVWRYTHRSFILDWTEDRAVGPRDAFGTDGVALARAGSDDPVYSRLARFAHDRAAR